MTSVEGYCVIFIDSSWVEDYCQGSLVQDRDGELVQGCYIVIVC